MVPIPHPSHCHCLVALEATGFCREKGRAETGRREKDGWEEQDGKRLMSQNKDVGPRSRKEKRRHKGTGGTTGREMLEAT